jgi:N-methylhydantoinase B
VTVHGEELEIDLTACPPQRAGGCGNATWVSSGAAARVAFKCITLPHAVTNGGSYRPLTVRTRPGTVVHPLPGAPVTCWGDIGRAIIECVLRAVGQGDPSRSIAGFYGNVDALAISGAHPRTGEPFIHFSPYAGGWGARAERDGINALCPIINGDNANVPCEVVEQRYPLRVDRYELIPDSGGAGRHRGGLGVRIDYRVLAGEVSVSASLDRYAIAPPGVAGGADGALSGLYVVDPDGTEHPAHKCAGLTVGRDAVISHRTGGGGGFGPPGERAPADVSEDLADGYVTPGAVAADCGIETTDAR